MRVPYQFNEKYKNDKSDWGYDAAQVTYDTIHYKKPHYSMFDEKRGIEEQIEKISSSIGGLAEVLISKGLLSPQEFLVAIGADEKYEVREKKTYG